MYRAPTNYHNYRRLVHSIGVSSRNAEARREYQIQYNKIRRVTRRKVGKKELLKMRENKREELEGKVP